MHYDHQKIEKKWQKKWEEEGYNEAQANVSLGPKQYVLDMFPYPSAAGLHVGHPEGYTATDIYTRYLKMNGYNVLHPMGWDAFGLPAENYAIKNGIHPAQSTLENIATFKRQIKALGFDYNWAHEVNTSDPSYYKWTQWFFLLLYKSGLAYRAEAPVNWCESCKTVLANEQVVEGACERCRNEVFKKRMKQWFLKITDFAEDLLSGLKEIDWPNSIKLMQENWIGRSEGLEEYWQVEGMDIKLPSFTTWPHTSWGATFMAIASEHQVIVDLVQGTDYAHGAEEFVKRMEMQKRAERMNEAKEKEGYFTGRYALNHLTGWKMPIYIANFAIMEYGTGIVKGCPAHDERDFEFAKKYNLPIQIVISTQLKNSEKISEFSASSRLAQKADIVTDTNITHSFMRVKRVVEPATGIEPAELDVTMPAPHQTTGSPPSYQEVSAFVKSAYGGEGVMINAGKFTGMDAEEARAAVAEYIIKQGNGKKAVHYKLRDWLISRQRYWGAPIPIMYCPSCKEVPVPEKDLPVMLPDDVDFKPTGESPLALSKSFHNVSCPQCGANEGVRRESDTMDTFVCSSWYFLRYASPNDDVLAFDKEKVRFWLPVDMYVGGAEHAVLHLLYARFFTRVLHKLGHVAFSEPFLKLRNQGMILGEDRQKMSKSRGNVINPDEIVKEYGADAMRIYEMFMGPLEDTKPWQTKGLIGVRRFFKKLIALIQKHDPHAYEGEYEGILQKTIKKVTEDIEAFRFNTAVSSLMILVNELGRYEKLGTRVLEHAVILLAPFAPHLCEELWEQLGHTASVFASRWPEFDEEHIRQNKVVIAVQINGKVRAQLSVFAGISLEEVETMALAQKNIQAHLAGKEIKKKFYVQDKILSFVVV